MNKNRKVFALFRQKHYSNCSFFNSPLITLVDREREAQNVSNTTNNNRMKGNKLNKCEICVKSHNHHQAKQAIKMAEHNKNTR